MGGAPGSVEKADEKPFALAAPQLSLPHGGGAVRGIGEKFATEPATGTGSLTVPIRVSRGRNDFSPELTLSYDSGSGNGPFGMGWSLSVPAITRRTDKGLPQYRDADDSDVFVLSGVEDLVPVFGKNPDGSWARDPQGRLVFDEELRDGHTVRRYRPRVEGHFARMERWTRVVDGDVHWRSISKDNILTVYGRTSASRIADHAKAACVFSWLMCETYDDKGNAIVYEHAAEDDANVDLSQVNERNRLRSANRYVKYIRYGNRRPLLVDATLPGFRRAHVPAPDFSTAGWMFEVVFDYGEGHYQEMPPDANGRIFANASLKPPAGGTWPRRRDPFSTYRSCFEVRSYRLCRRVLMFHHFPEELGVEDYLVHATELGYLEKPNGSFVSQIVQSGFKAVAALGYLKQSLPALDLEYSRSPLDDLTHDRLPVQEVAEPDVHNLPSGVDGDRYRWVDLDGEGISGVLSEQGNGWFYKANLGSGQLGTTERVSLRPSLAELSRATQQLLDLAGDGNLDLVDLEGPSPGFFARTDEAGWNAFRTFTSLPNIDWQNPNLRFVDLTGDGHADVLVTEEDVFFTWHESRAEEGYGPAARVSLPVDEEAGPRLVFADGTQSIFLADMSGDGLTDLVRIHKGEVCYWPNIGYGRFGARVTMDHAPRFDDATSFDPGRIHLADVDGSGPTDILYLGRDGVRVYLNQHGNGWSEARLLSRVPHIDNLTSVAVADFLGRGTACLLWSSPLAADARRPLRYLDLMGGVKPHLLTTVRNNLGAQTHVEYASSTQFYLADKAAGTPWITRLPFPVHVVTKVETRDLISGNRLVTRSAYHHGYFDGIEREFRGFGRVDRWDAEEFGAASAFHVPPALTKTWFHTGAYFAGERISRLLEDEYYHEGDADQPGSELSLAQQEAMLLEDTALPVGLAAEEVREAVRSLKGSVLRQEIYAVDDKDASDRPYLVSERNYTIRHMQPRGENRHSVFFTHARETVEFHYERKLFPVLSQKVVDAATAALDPATRWLADPRVTQTVTLEVDDFGNVLQSAVISYGRRFDDVSDPVLSDADRTKQKQSLVTVTESSVTNVALAANAWRTPLPAVSRTYELIRLQPKSKQPDITNLVRFDEWVSTVAQAGDGAHDLSYHDINPSGATGAGVYRRIIEETRTRYRSNDLAQLLPLHTLEALALTGESYRLALTPGLLTTVYRRLRPPQPIENLLPVAADVLPVDTMHESDRGGYVDLDGDGRWWVPSGRSFFHPVEGASAAVELAEAITHFFLPRRLQNPFRRSDFVDYLKDLLPAKTRDALGNTTEATYDWRVLQPRELTDFNGNRSLAAFDTLGMAVAIALCGKSTETRGDSLGGFGDFDADPALAQLQDFVARPTDFKAAFLKSATRRFVYDLGRFRRCGQPPLTATVVRETHVSDAPQPTSVLIQVSFVYSDGFGRELLTKVPAEPGDAPLRAVPVALPGGDVRTGALALNAGVPVPGATNSRWVGKGRTLYNNKGKPVKQYEPFFSGTHLYEAEPEMAQTGVTPIVFYDAVERVVATLHPNHTYEKVVFDPWHEEKWDVNDTVKLTNPATDSDVGEFFQPLPTADYLPTWYSQRIAGLKGPDEQAAAQRAADHAATPEIAYLDTLGRRMLTIADNGKDSGGAPVMYATRVTLDIENNQREITDANDRVVVRYDYDMLGNRIHQSSMEAGQRWMLGDVAGKPIRGWDSRGHMMRTEFDELRRASRSFVIGAVAADPVREICFEQRLYGESAGTGLSAAQVLQSNLRGRLYKQRDTAGVVTHMAYDFKGNLLRSARELLRDYKNPPDWSLATQPALEAEIFTGSVRYDALNRPVQVVAPRSDRLNAPINVIRPGYNEASLLERVDMWLGQAVEPPGLLDPSSANLHAVTQIAYDAKGQRTGIDYGNGVSTSYFHDEQTFRLMRLRTRRAAGGAAGSVFQDLFYAYDPAGNITHIRDDAQQTIYFNGQMVAPQCDYVYDPVYRLIRATGREHIGQLSQPQTTWADEFRTNRPQPGNVQAMRNYAEQYVYDAVGNIERLIHQAGSGNWQRACAYGEASLIEPLTRKSNRLSSAMVSGSAETFTYDAHGNTTGMSHLTLMQWDFRDRLSATSRQAGGTPETTFLAYDSDARRVRKVTERQNGTRKSERIYLDSFEVHREFAANGVDATLERETLHVTDDERRIAMVETRTRGADASASLLVRYQLSNHLGSACLELDDAARVISYEEYFPYGSTSYQAVDRAIKAAAKRYRFTGRERDEETGFCHCARRYYIPWLGRWASCDPAGIVDGTNLFRYARANPIIFTDASGTQSKLQLTMPKPRTYADYQDSVKRGNAAPAGQVKLPAKTDVNVLTPAQRAELQKPQPAPDTPDKPCLVEPPPDKPAPAVSPVPSTAEMPTQTPHSKPVGPARQEPDPDRTKKDPSLALAPDPNPKPLPERSTGVGVDPNADPAARVSQSNSSSATRSADESDVTDQPVVNEKLDRLQDKVEADTRKDFGEGGQIALGIGGLGIVGGAVAGMQTDPESPAGKSAIKKKKLVLVLKLPVVGRTKVRVWNDFSPEPPRPDPSNPPVPGVGFPGAPTIKGGFELEFKFK
ncbi:SpvB/TcaC N-terminal domain-containing protein [Paraburkholderia hospita]|nr:SpvB/TcaC N-terminal domain-containing protein [Paraburkholderia hospita]